MTASPTVKHNSNHSSFTVRVARRADIDAMIEMQTAMALQTEGLRLDASTLRRGMTIPFERPNIATFYVAEEPSNGKVVGMMMTTQEWSDWRAGCIIWIQSVYVRPEWTRRGVYRFLYEHLKRMVEEDSFYIGIRLYVEHENSNAIAVYKRMGMTMEHYHMMKWIKSKY